MTCPICRDTITALLFLEHQEHWIELPNGKNFMIDTGVRACLKCASVMNVGGAAAAGFVVVERGK